LTSRYRMFTPHVCTSTRGASDDWKGLTGHISRQMLETIAPDIHERHVYMCGPAGFMDAVTAILREMRWLHTRSSLLHPAATPHGSLTLAEAPPIDADLRHRIAEQRHEPIAELLGDLAAHDAASR
jgi:ferredoxin-NADP reductase